jgi:hypothetical protein
MKLSDSITEILKAETAGLTLGINQEGKVWGVVQHMVETGPGCRMEITHKAETSSVVDTVGKLCESFNRAELNRKKIAAPEVPKIIKP